MSLQVQPITLREAWTFVGLHHRHHKKVSRFHGGLFALGASDGPQLVAVVIVGRPVARFFDDGWTAEVTRLCALEGQRNACSFLYSKAKHAAQALGYRRVITYILQSEPGTSLKAAGWKLTNAVAGDRRGWNRPKRFRVDEAPLVQKQLWEAPL